MPLEAEVLSPDVDRPDLAHDAVRGLPVFLGKRQCRVDDFFEVEGEGSDELEIRGDAGKVKWIGRGMTRGRIAIDGNAGMHLGAYMKGGTIEVTGNASDWVGAEMSGGLIHDSRQRRRSGRRGLPGQPAGHEGRDDPRSTARPASKSACG